jgi:hypothetical protein
MALISIPTSISGVSIPGAAVNGPLGALYQNKFGRTDLQYPRDLQSATRGHYVKFEINEYIKPANFSTERVLSFLGDAVTESTATLVAGNLGATVAGTVATVKRGPDTIEDYINDPNTVKKLIGFTQPDKKSAGSISLYIPETVNFTYNAQYDKLSISQAAQQTPLINRVAKPVLSTLERNGALKLILRGQGLAFNPQQQLLFDGIDFRTYQMAFVFTPYSKQEAETVEKIIKQFKVHSAPKIANFGAGMFFIPPSTFTPKFFFNDQENKKISRIAESVIESVDVNYAPNGFSTMSDGAATQIQLTINFKEIELITREKIEQGY